MFKDFLEKKLEDKGKQIEQRSKLDKEVVQLKFKGNQKQFELNAELDAILKALKLKLKASSQTYRRTRKFPKKAGNVFESDRS